MAIKYIDELEKYRGKKIPFEYIDSQLLQYIVAHSNKINNDTDDHIISALVDLKNKKIEIKSLKRIEVEMLTQNLKEMINVKKSLEDLVYEQGQDSYLNSLVSTKEKIKKMKALIVERLGEL